MKDYKSFIEWFVGLCDAESYFLIRIRRNEKGEVAGFEFVFKIALHKDDSKVLEVSRCLIIKLPALNLRFERLKNLIYF